jgi:hypothetical protein
VSGSGQASGKEIMVERGGVEWGSGAGRWRAKSKGDQERVCIR